MSKLQYSVEHRGVGDDAPRLAVQHMNGALSASSQYLAPFDKSGPIVHTKPPPDTCHHTTPAVVMCWYSNATLDRASCKDHTPNHSVHPPKNSSLHRRPDHETTWPEVRLLAANPICHQRGGLSVWHFLFMYVILATCMTQPCYAIWNWFGLGSNEANSGDGKASATNDAPSKTSPWDTIVNVINVQASVPVPNGMPNKFPRISLYDELNSPHLRAEAATLPPRNEGQTHPNRSSEPVVKQPGPVSRTLQVPSPTPRVTATPLQRPALINTHVSSFPLLDSIPTNLETHILNPPQATALSVLYPPQKSTSSLPTSPYPAVCSITLPQVNHNKSSTDRLKEPTPSTEASLIPDMNAEPLSMAVSPETSSLNEPNALDPSPEPKEPAPEKSAPISNAAQHAACAPTGTEVVTSGSPPPPQTPTPEAEPVASHPAPEPIEPVPEKRAYSVLQHEPAPEQGMKPTPSLLDPLASNPPISPSRTHACTLPSYEPAKSSQGTPTGNSHSPSDTNSRLEGSHGKGERVRTLSGGRQGVEPASRTTATSPPQVTPRPMRRVSLYTAHRPIMFHTSTTVAHQVVPSPRPTVVVRSLFVIMVLVAIIVFLVVVLIALLIAIRIRRRRKRFRGRCFAPKPSFQNPPKGRKIFQSLNHIHVGEVMEPAECLILECDMPQPGATRTGHRWEPDTWELPLCQSSPSQESCCVREHEEAKECVNIVPK